MRSRPLRARASRRRSSASTNRVVATIRARNRRFRLLRWTDLSCIHSSPSSSRARGLPTSRRLCRRGRACLSLRCRSCSRPSTRRSGGAVRGGSGLGPPPHLVGERARALDVLARGGLVCASAAALAEGVPPPDARPAPIEIEQGEEPGIDLLAEGFALAGYERVERVEERGQFAVRGGLVDVFPTTGREPLPIELFGDEIESNRAFSPFTQRTLHSVEQATIYPAAERRLDLAVESWVDEGPR